RHGSAPAWTFGRPLCKTRSGSCHHHGSRTDGSPPGERLMRSFLNAARFAGVALLGVLLAAWGSGCGPSGKRIIILTNGNSPFWDAARVGLQEAEKDFKLKDAGLRAVVEVNDGTDRGQLDKLRQFTSQSDIVAVGVSVNTAGNEAIAQQMQ